MGLPHTVCPSSGKYDHPLHPSVRPRWASHNVGTSSAASLIIHCILLRERGLTQRGGGHHTLPSLLERNRPPCSHLGGRGPWTCCWASAKKRLSYPASPHSARRTECLAFFDRLHEECAHAEDRLARHGRAAAGSPSQLLPPRIRHRGGNGATMTCCRTAAQRQQDRMHGLFRSLARKNAPTLRIGFLIMGDRCLKSTKTEPPSVLRSRGLPPCRLLADPCVNQNRRLLFGCPAIRPSVFCSGVVVFASALRLY